MVDFIKFKFQMQTKNAEAEPMDHKVSRCDVTPMELGLPAFQVLSAQEHVCHHGPPQMIHSKLHLS